MPHGSAIMRKTSACDPRNGNMWPNPGAYEGDEHLQNVEGRELILVTSINRYIWYTIVLGKCALSLNSVVLGLSERSGNEGATLDVITKGTTLTSVSNLYVAAQCSLLIRAFWRLIYTHLSKQPLYFRSYMKELCE